MGFNEADTRAKLIDPALHARGWTEDLIRREETAGTVDLVDGRPRRRGKGRVDYTLRVRITPAAQPLALALLEAKAEDLPPTRGLEQAKTYAACRRLHVGLAFSSNGHLFVEYDGETGLTSPPRPLSEFPTPAALRARYEAAVGVSLEAPLASPLLTRYAGGEEGTRRYYILIATHRALDVATDEATASFLTTHYPENYFSHIVIDECHRSAWGKWSQVLLRNPDAVQIGLTATPRKLELAERTPESLADARISADNLRHFGPPVYEYDMAQGIEDGYLAACEIVRRDIFLDDKPRNERETGIEHADLQDKVVRDANTGEVLGWIQANSRYEATAFEDRLLLPERVAEMTGDLFAHLLATGGPEQKTIVFCARDRHADDVASALNNLYARWCAAEGRARLEPYAFKCTASVDGAGSLPDLRGASRHHFIATTVDLLTTGVDVPCVRNIVFFKYVRSPIAFYQMVGRGTRIDPPMGKLMFRVYDYTDATRLFGEEFTSRFAPTRKRAPGAGREEEETPTERTLLVEGFDVRVTDAGRYIVTQVDGRALPVTVEEYKERLARRLVEEAPTLEAFRNRWIDPPKRQELLGRLPDAGRSAFLVRALDDMANYDLYDVLGELGYGLAPRTRPERAGAFDSKHDRWLAALPPRTAATLRALTAQFARAGTDGLESPEVFETPEVVRAGGLGALKALGRPADILRETKQRLFAA